MYTYVPILLAIRAISSPCLWLGQVVVPFDALEAKDLPKKLAASEWWQRLVEMPKEVLEARLSWRLQRDLIW